MKIKMRTLCAGASGVMQAGGVYDVPDATGKALVEAGYALSVAAGEKIETAVPVPIMVETAVMPEPVATGPRGRKRF